MAHRNMARKRQIKGLGAKARGGKLLVCGPKLFVPHVSNEAGQGLYLFYSVLSSAPPAGLAPSEHPINTDGRPAGGIT